MILLFLLVFGLTPLVLAVAITLPLVLDRVALFYQKAYLQNLRADVRDLDQHLASRYEMIRLLAKLPEPGLILGEQGDEDEIDRARARYTGWINQILGEQRDIVQILFLDAEGQERFWLERDLHSMEWRPTAQMPDRPSEELVVAGRHLPPGEILVSRIRVEPSAGASDPRQLMRLNLVSAIGKDNHFSPSGLVVMTIDVGGLATFYRSRSVTCSKRGRSSEVSNRLERLSMKSTLRPDLRWRRCHFAGKSPAPSARSGYSGYGGIAGQGFVEHLRPCPGPGGR